MNRKHHYLRLLLICCLPLLASCQQKTKFEWDPAVSAPLHYPATINLKLDYDTLSKKDDDGVGIISTTGRDGMGWGIGSGPSVGERFKPVPERARVRYYSHLEGCTYEVSIPLPQAKLLKMFSDGYLSHVVGMPEKQTPYSGIMAGCAPGGVVVIWMFGNNREEVARGQARVIARKPATYRDSLADDDKAWLQKNGLHLGNWGYYPAKYDWQPVLLSSASYKIRGYGFMTDPVTGHGSILYGNWGPPSPADSWAAVQKNQQFTGKKYLPSFIELSFQSTEDDVDSSATQADITLPVKDLHNYFTNGYTKSDGTKGRYKKLVFEIIGKGNAIAVWVLGDDGRKVKLGEFETILQDHDGNELYRKKR